MTRLSLTMRVMPLIWMIGLNHYCYAYALDGDIQSILRQRFATAILFSDSDAIELGFGSFNPNDVFRTGNNALGSQESLNERRNKSVYILPMSKAFSVEGSENSHRVTAKVYGIVTNNDIKLFDQQAQKDELDELILGAAVGYGYQYNVTPLFSVTPSITSHLIYYENAFNANNALSSFIEVLLDKRLFNVSAWANVFEPSLTFDYHQPTTWGRWHMSSAWNYFYGYTWGEANDGQIGHPEGWYLANAVYGYIDINQQKQSLFMGVKRVDLSHDLEDELGTNHYYEWSVGWLFNHPTQWEWLDNIGVGLNINYGSSLKGGSLVFYYNKD